LSLVFPTEWEHPNAKDVLRPFVIFLLEDEEDDEEEED